MKTAPTGSHAATLERFSYALNRAIGPLKHPRRTNNNTGKFSLNCLHDRYTTCPSGAEGAALVFCCGSLPPPEIKKI